MREPGNIFSKDKSIKIPELRAPDDSPNANDTMILLNRVFPSRRTFRRVSSSLSAELSPRLDETNDRKPPRNIANPLDKEKNREIAVCLLLIAKDNTYNVPFSRKRNTRVEYRVSLRKYSRILHKLDLQTVYNRLLNKSKKGTPDISTLALIYDNRAASIRIHVNFFDARADRKCLKITILQLLTSSECFCEQLSNVLLGTSITGSLDLKKLLVFIRNCFGDAFLVQNK